MKTTKHKHLIIGPLPPPLGGATVLFKQLVDESMENGEIDLIVINTVHSTHGFLGRVFSLVHVISHTFLNIGRCNTIAFHGSVNGVTLFTPLLFIISRLFKKPIVVRIFGGAVDEKFESMNFFGKILFKKFLLQCDAVLFETKSSLSKFLNFPCKSVYWYPNSRPVPKLLKAEHTSLGRIVFLGHIKPEKGVLQLVEAGQGLSAHIDFYGPLVSGITPDQLTTQNTAYKGILNPAEIIDTLNNYDLLVLPTYYQGEGYPGVIIEAYMAGIPVISTNWRCIPEIVDSDSGLLVEPRSSVALRRAIELLLSDGELYKRLTIGAQKKSEIFDSVHWTRFYINLIKGLNH